MEIRYLQGAPEMPIDEDKHQLDVSRVTIDFRYFTVKRKIYFYEIQKEFEQKIHLPQLLYFFFSFPVGKKKCCQSAKRWRFVVIKSVIIHLPNRIFIIL